MSCRGTFIGTPPLLDRCMPIVLIVLRILVWSRGFKLIQTNALSMTFIVFIARSLVVVAVCVYLSVV